MSAKIKLYKTPFKFIYFIIIFIVIPIKVYSFEMECGTYDVMGRFDSFKNNLHIYENTEASKTLKLYGKNLMAEGSFRGNKMHYRMKVKIPKKIWNSDGFAEFLKIEEIVSYTPKQMQYKLIKSEACTF